MEYQKPTFKTYVSYDVVQVQPSDNFDWFIFERNGINGETLMCGYIETCANLNCNYDMAEIRRIAENAIA